MRIGVAVGWPFRYTTCWVELIVTCWSSESLESGESDLIFLELEIQLQKGSLNCFHRLMNSDHTPCADWREDQQLLSLLGFCCHRRCRPHPLEIDEFPWIFTAKIGFVIEKLVAPKAQRVGWLRGPHLNRHKSASCFSVLFRRNVWGLEGGTRGLLLPCDGMILTKSNIQRQRGGKTSRKWEYKSPRNRRVSQC